MTIMIHKFLILVVPSTYVPITIGLTLVNPVKVDPVMILPEMYNFRKIYKTIE